MSRKIIGFKLIKEYPSSGPIGMELRTKSKNPDLKDYWFNKSHGNNESIMLNFPEFWEPIYEDKIDLNNLYKELWDRNTHRLGPIDISILAMKEACRQTLELVINSIHTEDTFNKEYIRNLINKIKW